MGILGTAVYTIVTASNFYKAITLMESIRFHNSRIDCFVGLVEAHGFSFDSSKSHFEIISVEDVDVPGGRRQVFKYTAHELCCSLKPVFMEHVLKRGYRNVIYLDADVLFYDDPETLTLPLESHDLVLSPHTCEPLQDGFIPDDLAILRAGTFNAGFIAVRASHAINLFMTWWKGILSSACYRDPALGFTSTDQKWLNLVPALFPSLFVDRSPGVNVAYWNLPHRDVTSDGAKYYVNGEHLIFFHFSGLVPISPFILSKYDERFRGKPLPVIVEGLVHDYIRRLEENGMDLFAGRRYSYDYFSDGKTYIPPIVRRIFREEQSIQEVYGDDPFDLTADPGFRRSYNKRVMGRTNPVTLLALYIYNNNHGLQKRFPHILGKGALEYYDWFILRGREQYDLPDAFAEPSLEREISAHINIRKKLSHKVLYFLRTAVSLILNSSLAHRSPTHEKTSGSDETISTVSKNMAHRLAGLCLRASRAIIPPELGRRGFDWLRCKLIELTYSVHTRERYGVVGSVPPIEGFNLVGFLLAEMGLGEGARCTWKAALAAGIRVNPIVFKQCAQRQEAALPEALDKKIETDFSVSLIHLNPEALGNLIATSDFEKLMGHYRIGYWVWETTDFPPEWHRAARPFDEIWTASTFCQEIFSRNLFIPVVKIPHCIEPEIPEGVTREDLGLPPKGFIFLCMADMFSTPERKNILGAVKAFLGARWSRHDECYLVIKISNSFHRPDTLQLLNEYVGQYTSIILIDGYLDRAHVNALVNCCDCFVSLHRAEGFGLPIAEAMYMGKPVIATGWSGNMDYMTPWNSFPVRYKKVYIPDTVGSYKKGSTWSEPDVDHCTELMRTVVSDGDHAKRVGDTAASDIRRNYSSMKIGRMIRNRLDRIGCAPDKPDS